MPPACARRDHPEEVAPDCSKRRVSAVRRLVALAARQEALSPAAEGLPHFPVSAGQGMGGAETLGARELIEEDKWYLLQLGGWCLAKESVLSKPRQFGLGPIRGRLADD